MVLVIVAAGATALVVAAWLVPRPDLEEPCGGPRWYRTLINLENRIAKGVEEHAADHEDRTTRAYAARLVGLLRPAGATRALLPLLDDKNPEVRTAALDGIGCDGDPAAVEVLAEALAARPGRGRLSWTGEQAIWQALARAGTPEAFDLFLREADRHERRWHRAHILELLAEGGEAAVPVLTRLLNSESGEVRKAARKALGKIRSGRAIEPADDR